MNSDHCKKYLAKKQKKIVQTVAAVDISLVCLTCESEISELNFNVDLGEKLAPKAYLNLKNR